MIVFNFLKHLLVIGLIIGLVIGLFICLAIGLGGKYLVLSSPHHERTLAAAASRHAKECGLFFKFLSDKT